MLTHDYKIQILYAKRKYTAKNFVQIYIYIIIKRETPNQPVSNNVFINYN